MSTAKCSLCQEVSEKYYIMSFNGKVKINICSNCHMLFSAHVQDNDIQSMLWLRQFSGFSTHEALSSTYGDYNTKLLLASRKKFDELLGIKTDEGL